MISRYLSPSAERERDDQGRVDRERVDVGVELQVEPRAEVAVGVLLRLDRSRSARPARRRCGPRCRARACRRCGPGPRSGRWARTAGRCWRCRRGRRRGSTTITVSAPTIVGLAAEPRRSAAPHRCPPRVADEEAPSAVGRRASARRRGARSGGRRSSVGSWRRLVDLRLARGWARSGSAASSAGLDPAPARPAVPCCCWSRRLAALVGRRLPTVVGRGRGRLVAAPRSLRLRRCALLLRLLAVLFRFVGRRDGCVEVGDAVDQRAWSRSRRSW